MPSLKDKSICLLGTLTGQSLVAGSVTIFTTPAGKKTRITHVVFRDPSASAAAATNMALTGFPGTLSLVNLITPDTGYVVFHAAPVPATPAQPLQGTEIAAGTAVVLTITTGASVTAGIDVFGYTT